MRNLDDRFEQAEREQDPVRQAQLATELIPVYQQRAVELGRLRKAAINRAAEEQGKNYSAIAAEIGLTRGRIAQIRKSAPPAEREFFGIGPVNVAAPLRQMPDRSQPMHAGEDSRSVEVLKDFLTNQLTFHVERYDIPPSGDWTPKSEAVAICGPKSSPVTAAAIENDPVFDFRQDSDARWKIFDRASGYAYCSPMDEDEPRQSDIAYVGRTSYQGSPLIIIAGVHAIGSLGAVDYLTRELPTLYKQVGTESFSMIVGSTYQGLEIIESHLVAGPQRH